MKYIVSFLLVVLAFSSFMALSMDCCPKAKPLAMPVEYCRPVKRIKNYPTGKPAQYQPPAKPVQYQPPARPVQPPIAAVYETPDNPAETEDEENEEPEDYEQPEDYSEPLPYSDNIIVQEIMNTFGHEWKTALAIARAESSLNSRAVNQNRNGTRDIGIFQINDCHGWSDSERYDWKNNIAMAKEIRDRYGWSAWSVYNSGQFRQFM